MQHTDVLTARIGSVTAPRTRMQRRRAFLNSAARVVVGAGGMATIVSIAAILGFILVEVIPLWRSPSATMVSSFDAPSAAVVDALAGDEHRHVVPLPQPDGTINFVRLADGGIASSLTVPGLNGEHIARVLAVQHPRLLLLTDKGRLLANTLLYTYPGDDVVNVPQPAIAADASWNPTSDGRVPRLIATSTPAGGVITAVYVDSGAPQLFAVAEKRNLFGAQRAEIRRELPLRFGGEATAVVVDRRGDYAYVGSSNGYVQRWDLRDKADPKVSDAADATLRRDIPVTALALLIGEQSLIVGDAAGHVTRWFTVRDPEMKSGWRLQRIDSLQPHRAAVTAIAASPRDKGFMTADAEGNVLVRHATTERTLLTLSGATGAVTALAFAPKGNGALARDATGRLVNWSIQNPHPEITLGTLFGKIWYEGYDGPSYVWQSTGGTDTAEPKFSLVPLILGTMKGTLYALLFAVPIAVLGALYTSQFAHPRLRGFIKPTVEIMAALPSVVLGFLAGLWLAPTIERIVPGVMAMMLIVPLSIVMAGVAWGSLPASVRSYMRPGMELVLLLPLVLIAAQVSLWASAPLEAWLFGGDFQTWLHEAGGRFDQRNCIVVGFAMGFAVIPIIFTISEDAISNVPPRLVSGSLALGATPWQTAMRVVLPTASAGIFSAVMVGFGLFSSVPVVSNTIFRSASWSG